MKILIFQIFLKILKPQKIPILVKLDFSYMRSEIFAILYDYSITYIYNVYKIY